MQDYATRCKFVDEVHRVTEGAFDPSSRSLDEMWDDMKHTLTTATETHVPALPCEAYRPWISQGYPRLDPVENQSPH